MIEMIANIFGAIIRVIYNLTQDNYALSIILFTILAKTLLFPLSLKQMKSSKEMQKVKPKYDEIIKKYKNDKTKQGEEITKLYSEHKINPLGGCLPILIQLPLILGMFYIVNQPLTYVIQLPKDEIEIYTKQLLNKEEVSKTEMNTSEIVIANNNKLIDMNFIGLNLGHKPSDVFSSKDENNTNPLSLIIPILSVLFSIYQIKQMQNSTEMTDEQKQMQKSMSLMMPILSGFIAYTMPLALGIYWLISSMYQIAQQSVISKLIEEHKKDDVNFLLDSDKGGKK
ncbi:MAG: YidC/Oxa1 family membrane protein insertase [Clostridia bacterium]|nr:YidC/Oxa1 family membrane protein insertase [Clostridia bacterium]MDD4386331.1 YidC/Oxa1 family membrane protein insertase [Clostridia bacterium]